MVNGLAARMILQQLEDIVGQLKQSQKTVNGCFGSRAEGYRSRYPAGHVNGIYEATVFVERL